MNELINVRIITKNGINYVSSRVIAEELGKEHKILLRDCRQNLLEGVEFVPSTYKTAQNKEATEYLLTKDGFVLLMMNYQGYNDFKRAYINRFNEMEEMLKNNTLSLPKTYKEALKELLEQVEKNEKLELENKEMKPKAEFYDTVAESKDAIPMNEVAKVLNYKGYGRNRLFEFLRNNNVLMSNNLPYQTYIDKGYFRVIEQKFSKPNGDVTIYIKTLVYQKGIDFIKRLLDSKG